MTYRKHNSKWLLCCIAVGAAILSLTAPPSMADYLVQPDAYWQFETDPSAGVADDIATITGTCEGTECSETGALGTGTVGNSLVLDGSTIIRFAKEDPSIPDGTFDISGADGFSIEMWIKRSGNPVDFEAMISRVTEPVGSGAAWWIGLNSNGAVHCDFWDTKGQPTPMDRVEFNGKTYVTDNQWHHIVVVRDGATDQMMIYVDGVLDVAVDQSTHDNTDEDFDTDADVRIGEINTVYQLLGELDGIAIYKGTVLSADVIAQNYANGLNGHDLDEPFAATLAATASDTAAWGSAATLRVLAAGNPAPTYAGANLPAGASIDSTSGVITWVPQSNQTGVNDIEITATNTGGSATQTLTVSVDDLCEDNLDAYWKLDDADPTAGVIDEKGNINGTCVDDGCPASGAGLIGNALAFNEAGDNVEFADSPAFAFDGTEGFSFELWIKRDGTTLTGDETVIGRFTPDSAAWRIFIDSTGVVKADFIDNSGPRVSTEIAGTSSVADNEWHHVAVVRDGVSQTMKIYVDGKLERNENQTGNETVTGSYDLSTYDPDNDPNTPPPPAVLGQFNGLQQFAGELDEVAIYNKALSATEVAQHATAGADLLICNNPPRFTTTAVTTAAQGVAYEYASAAEDSDGHDITFSLTTAPTGMTVDASTGVVSWTPAAGVSAQESVILAAADPYGGVITQAYTIDVTIEAGSNPPVISTTAPTMAYEENEYRYDADATDDDGDTLSWSISGAPAGMTVDAATGLVTWTPPAGAAAAGDVTFTLTVTDGANTDTESVTLTVSDEDPPTPATGGGGGGGGGCFIGSMGF